MVMVAVVAAVWAVCGVLTYGFTLGYFDHSFPEIAWDDGPEHVSTALTFALLGPVGLLVALLNTAGKRRWFALTPLTYEQVCEARRRRGWDPPKR